MLTVCQEKETANHRKKTKEQTNKQTTRQTLMSKLNAIVAAAAAEARAKRLLTTFASALPIKHE